MKKGGFIGLKPYLNNSPQYIPSNEIRIYDFLTPEHLEAAGRTVRRNKLCPGNAALGMILSVKLLFPDMGMDINKRFGKKIQPMSNVYQTNEYTEECSRKYGLPAFFCTDYTMSGECFSTSKAVPRSSLE